MKIFLKIILGAVLALVGFVVGMYVYLFLLGGLERVLNDRLSQLEDSGYHLRVRVGEIEGSLFNELFLRHLVVDYVDDTSDYRMAEVPLASASYSLTDLWRGNLYLKSLRIDSVELTIRQDTSGQWMIPRPERSASESRGSRARVEELLIGSLELNDARATVIRRNDTLLVSDLDLKASLNLINETFSIDLDRLAFDSNDPRLNLTSGSGRVTLTKNLMVVQNLALLSADTRIRLDGSFGYRDPVEGQIRFTLDNADIERYTRGLGPHLYGNVDVNGDLHLAGDSLSGRVQLAGDFQQFSFRNLNVDFSLKDRLLAFDSLYGTILDHCLINGHGAMDFAVRPERFWLDADIRKFDLSRLVPKAPQSDLTGKIKLRGSGLTNRSLELRVETDLFESSFGGYPLHDAYGLVVVTTRDVTFPGPYRVTYYENEFLADGTIEYNGDIHLAVRANLYNLDRYRGKLFIDQPGGRAFGDAYLTGRTGDPDLSGYLASDSIWIYGVYGSDFFGRVDLDRFLTGRQGTVSANLRHGSLWNLPCDSMMTQLQIDSNMVFIDTVDITNGFSHAWSSGSLDYMVYPQELYFDTLALSLLDRRFFNRERIQVEVDSLGFDFRRAVLGNSDAKLSGLGRVDFDDSMDMLLSIDRAPVAPWAALVDDSNVVEGYLSCNARVKGTFDEPDFEVLGQIDSLVYNEVVLGNLESRLIYNNRLLNIDSLIVTSDSGRYRAEGALPINLAFTGEVLDRWPDVPMNVQVRAHDSEFSLVSYLMPSVEQLMGQFTADVTLTGTPTEPHLEGTASLYDAELKYLDLVDPIFADSARVFMRDNTIAIPKVEAYAIARDGKKRPAYIEGEITVKSLDNLNYDVYVTLPREFPFRYELDDIQGRVEGEMHVEGDTPPTVSGDLQLLSMEYRVEFAEADEGSPIMESLTADDSWNLNLNVDILSNYWIRNQDIDAEFAGEISVYREAGKYRFFGEMEVLRGKGFLVDKTFRLEQGSTVIFEGNETLNPRLDIIGRTRMTVVDRSSAISSEEPKTEQKEVGIHVTGTLDEPEINPADGSDFSREDLLPLIFANMSTSGDYAVQGQIGQRLTSLFSSQVSQIGARQLGRLGVETFEIDATSQGQLNELSASVTVGAYVASSPLYVYGRQDLALDQDPELGFEYRVSKRLLIQGRRDEDQLYHVGVRAHLEF